MARAGPSFWLWQLLCGPRLTDSPCREEAPQRAPPLPCAARLTDGEAGENAGTCDASLEPGSCRPGLVRPCPLGSLPRRPQTALT